MAGIAARNVFHMTAKGVRSSEGRGVGQLHIDEKIALVFFGQERGRKLRPTTKPPAVTPANKTRLMALRRIRIDSNAHSRWWPCQRHD